MSRVIAGSVVAVTAPGRSDPAGGQRRLLPRHRVVGFVEEPGLVHDPFDADAAGVDGVGADQPVGVPGGLDTEVGGVAATWRARWTGIRWSRTRFHSRGSRWWISWASAISCLGGERGPAEGGGELQPSELGDQRCARSGDRGQGFAVLVEKVGLAPPGVGSPSVAGCRSAHCAAATSSATSASVRAANADVARSSTQATTPGIGRCGAGHGVNSTIRHRHSNRPPQAQKPLRTRGFAIVTKS